MLYSIHNMNWIEFSCKVFLCLLLVQVNYNDSSISSLAKTNHVNRNFVFTYSAKLARILSYSGDNASSSTIQNVAACLPLYTNSCSHKAYS